MRSPPHEEASPCAVVAVTNLFPNPAEPVRATFNERQFTHLARGMPLSVVCPIPWLTALKLARAGRLAEVRAARQWKGLPVAYPVYFYLPRVLAGIRGWLMALAVAAPMRRAARLIGARVVLATWAYPDAFAAAVVARRLRLPLVVKVHGSDVEELDLGGQRTRQSLRGLRQAHAIVTVSEYLSRKLVGHGIEAARIHLLYNGVEAGTFARRDRAEALRECGLAPDTRFVLFVGNFKVDKGLLELLSPEMHAARERHGLRLAIIGDGGIRDEVRRLAAARPAGDVLLLGQKPAADIARWMNAAECLCLPSHHEGLPNVVLEALACGLPVLATTVGGIPEIVKPSNGVLVPPQQAAPLAAGLDQVMATSWDRAAIQDQRPGRSWEENAARLEALLRRAAAEGPRPR